MSGLSQYRKRVPRGEVLFREGEQGSHFLLLEKGILDIYVQDRRVNSLDAQLSQDFVGEVGAILGTPRTATVVAATDCVVLHLPKIDLENLLTISPTLGPKLVRSLCKKLVTSLNALAEIKAESAAILGSGSTDISLKNYMKGVLALLEPARDSPPNEQQKRALDYFLRTNPWGLQHGDPQQLLDTGAPGPGQGNHASPGAARPADRETTAKQD